VLPVVAWQEGKGLQRCEVPFLPHDSLRSCSILVVMLPLGPLGLAGVWQVKHRGIHRPGLVAGPFIQVLIIVRTGKKVLTHRVEFEWTAVLLHSSQTMRPLLSAKVQDTSH